MIPVYVREDLECGGVLFGEFSPSELPALIQRFRDHETYLPEKEYSCCFYSSQFVADNNGVFFEIVVEKGS